MRATRESDVLAACLQYLTLKGVFCWRQNNAPVPRGNGAYSFRGKKGVSDILGILPQAVGVTGEGMVTFGNFLAVECKRPGEQPTLDQEEFLATVNQLGGLGLCVHSVQELEGQLGRYL